MSEQLKEFHHVSFAQEVIFGSGSLSRLSEALDSLQLKRLMLCASSSIRSNGWISALERSLGERLVAIFDRVQHLHDAYIGLRESELPNLAQPAFQNRTVQNNPKPITNVIQIEQLLMDAW